MKIAIYGAGGVGGYFGARLAQAGAEVALLARGDHLQALRANGLVLKSTMGDARLSLRASDDPADIGPCDCVLFCVKGTDTERAASTLGPLLGPETFVVSLQNGVDNEQILSRHIGADRVLGGLVYIFSTIAGPGIVQHTGGPPQLIFGEWSGEKSPRAQRLYERCKAAGIAVELSDNVRSAIWEKFVFICALSGMTAASRAPLGAIRQTPESWAMFRRILEEVRGVAEREGISGTEGWVEKHLARSEKLGANSYSSLHYDLTHNKPMELQSLHGAVLRLARKHGLQVPMCEAVYALLLPWSASAR